MTGRGAPRDPEAHPDRAIAADRITASDRLIPKELSSAMAAALNGNPSPNASALLTAAEQLLGDVLGSECESRSAALDLLTVDALMTRALAAAADDPELLESFPELAMRRIASHSEGE